MVIKMYDYTKRFRIVTIVPTVLMLLFGVVTLLKPDLSNNFMAVVSGLLVILLGAINLYGFFKSYTFMRLQFYFSIVTMAFGVVVILVPLLFSTVITILFGIFMGISGLNKIYNAIEFKKVKDKSWTVILSMGILSIVCGLILIFQPLESLYFTTQVIGIFLIIYAIIDIMERLLLKDKEQEAVEVYKM